MELLWSNTPQIKAEHTQTMLIYYYSVREKPLNTNARCFASAWSCDQAGITWMFNETVWQNLALSAGCIHIHLFFDTGLVWVCRVLKIQQGRVHSTEVTQNRTECQTSTNDELHNLDPMTWKSGDKVPKDQQNNKTRQKT